GRQGHAWFFFRRAHQDARFQVPANSSNDLGVEMTSSFLLRPAAPARPEALALRRFRYGEENHMLAARLARRARRPAVDARRTDRVYESGVGASVTRLDRAPASQFVCETWPVAMSAMCSHFPYTLAKSREGWLSESCAQSRPTGSPRFATHQVAE